MKKTLLLWCAALVSVQGLAGCNSLVRSPCVSNCKSEPSPGLLQPKRLPEVTGKGSSSLDGFSAQFRSGQSSAKAPPKQAAKVAANTPQPPTITQTNPTVGQVAQNIAPVERVEPQVAAPGEKLEVAVLPTPTHVSVPIFERAMPVGEPVERAPEPKEAPEPAPVPAAPSVVKTEHVKAEETGTVLVGKVNEWRQTLRLRYAPVDQNDAHGGSVVLEGPPELQQLRDGQQIRARGILVPAPDRYSSAVFRVTAVEMID